MCRIEKVEIICYPEDIKIHDGILEQPTTKDLCPPPLPCPPRCQKCKNSGNSPGDTLQPFLDP